MPTSWSSIPPARCCTRSWAGRLANSIWVRFQSYCRGRVQRRFAPVRHEQKDLYDALLGAGLKRVCENCAIPQPTRRAQKRRSLGIPARDSDLSPTLPSPPRLHRKIRKRALVGMEKRSVVRAEVSAAAEEKLPSRAKWRILRCAGESVSQKTHRRGCHRWAKLCRAYGAGLSSHGRHGQITHCVLTQTSLRKIFPYTVTASAGCGSLSCRLGSYTQQGSSANKSPVSAYAEEP